MDTKIVKREFQKFANSISLDLPASGCQSIWTIPYKKNLAILLFDDVEVLDFTGPALYFSADRSLRNQRVSGATAKRYYPLDTFLRSSWKNHL